MSFFLDLSKIKEASGNIADAYIVFVSTVVEKMAKDENFKKNIQDASAYIDSVAKVIKATASSSTEFRKLVDNVAEIKGLKDIAAGKEGNYAELYVKSLIYLATKINESKVNFALANQHMILANQFMKNCVTASIHLKAIMANLEEIKGLAAYEKKLGQFTGSISKMNEIGKMEFTDGMNMVMFLQQSVTAANYLKAIHDIMNDTNMTKAIHTFVNNIQTLSSNDTSTKMSESSRTMGLFTKDLATFRNSLNVTKTQTVEFTVSVNNAVESIRSLDNAIFSREKKRNKSLQEFNELIQNIATSVEALSDKIEKLDKNQILENFKGIKDLLTMASGRTPEETKPANAPKTTTQAVQNTPEEKTPMVVQQPQKIFDNTIIEFRFDNVQFTGIATTKDY